MCRRRRGVAVAAARWRTCGAGSEVEQKMLVLWRAGGAEARVRAADGGGALAGSRRRRGRRCETAQAADGGTRRRQCGCGENGEGEGAAHSEKRAGGSEREESNMTCGPRIFSYRRLIRRLGFEHRLIASV
jgi:hypothetical protein